MFMFVLEGRQRVNNKDNNNTSFNSNLVLQTRFEALKSVFSGDRGGQIGCVDRPIVSNMQLDPKISRQVDSLTRWLAIPSPLTAEHELVEFSVLPRGLARGLFFAAAAAAARELSGPSAGADNKEVRGVRRRVSLPLHIASHKRRRHL